MLKQKVYSLDEISDIAFHATANGNHEGAAEAWDHHEYFGKQVKIVKGRKNIGFEGEVFWLKRMHYGTNPWFGFSTRVGIKNAEENVVFVSADNIEVVGG